MSKERFKVVPAVHLLLMRGKEILLLRRYKTGWMDGSYSVPAGHADGDERATTAMIREGHEEIGITISTDDLKLVHVMHRHSPEGKMNERVDFFFAAETWQGEPANMEPEKCDELKWFPISHLPQNMVPYVRAGIEASIQDVSYSEFGWE